MQPLTSATESHHHTASHLVIPPLYCPEPVRVDEILGDQVDDLLIPWIEQVGIFPDEQSKIRAAGFGRFAMLCHPDTDDPQRLLLSAQCIAALFAVDDYYCDDEATGSVPALVGPRLSLALAALEPAYVSEPYAAELERALRGDPVLAGLRSYMERVASFATPSQVARVRHEIIAMFVTMTAEAAWRMNGTTAAVWEYLAQRQVNSFLPCMSLIDIVGGYEIPAHIYSSPLVRRTTVLAASATIIANDIYSAQKESMTNLVDFNLPRLLAGEHHCSLQQGIALSVSIHDAIVHAYEAAEHELMHETTSSVLKRYLRGVKAWVGGSRAWHCSSARYRV